MIIDRQNLETLNFGAPAAERDINQGLIDYFVESEAYTRVRAGKKSIILGNRGSGKSAIFKIVAEQERRAGSLVIELSPENYSYEMLSSTMIPEERGSWVKQGAYTAAWKFLIYVLVMKELTRQGPRVKTGPAAQIYAYLRDKHAGTQENPISLLISYVKRIEGFKIGTWEASLKTHELTRLYRLEKIIGLLPALDELCKKGRLSF